MREEYEIEALNPRPNPYAKRTTQQISIRLDADTAEFFQAQAASSGIPFQTLINLYLADCAAQNRQLRLSWS